VDESRPEPPKIKVVDRRKFSTEGEPLETPITAAEPPACEEPAGESGPPTETPVPDNPTPKTSGQPSARFLELVAMLAGQAELLLVGTEEMPAQPAEAQRVIDYLGVLEEKTTGNLSAEESKVLSSILYQLRTYFLQRK
jgi:hypothetical protein